MVVDWPTISSQSNNQVLARFLHWSEKPASEAAGVVRNIQVHYARMMELVYLPDSKSGFCGFESHFGHH